jgi:integrase
MDHEVGIVRSVDGCRAFIRVRGHLYSKRFPPDTPLTVLRDWRAATRTDALRAAKFAAVPSGTFAEDVTNYLRAVKTMPTYAWREVDLDHWLAVLGASRTRQSITSAEIRAALQQWRTNGRKDGKPLSESACNHRRTALMHFFTVMNGKAGSNPCRDVPKFREPDPTPRGLTFAQLTRVFRAMPETKTKARAMVMAYTGIPHATLMRLEPGAVDYRAKTVLVPRRRKGSGTKPRVLPCSPEALTAFRLLDRYDGWGPFSRDSLRRSLQRACVTAKVTPIRGYDLRHSFAAHVYKESGDIGAVQGLLDHADQKMTARYTLSAIDGRMRSALNAGRKVTNAVTSHKKHQQRRA